MDLGYGPWFMINPQARYGSKCFSVWWDGRMKMTDTWPGVGGVCSIGVGLKWTSKDDPESWTSNSEIGVYWVRLRGIWETPLACLILLSAVLLMLNVLPIFFGLGTKSTPTLAARGRRPPASGSTPQL